MKCRTSKHEKASITYPFEMWMTNGHRILTLHHFLSFCDIREQLSCLVEYGRVGRVVRIMF